MQRSILDGQKIAARLGSDLLIAESSWAHFEALNGSTPEQRRNFREATHHLSFRLDDLIGMAVRDAILSLCRMSDPPGAKRDCMSLCHISSLLQNERLKKERLETARKWTPHLYEADPGLAEVNEGICEGDICFVLDHVTPKWDEKNKPKRRDFYDFREKIWPVRDALLAHAIDAARIDRPQVDLVRNGLKLTNNLVRASQRIFQGAAPTDSFNPLTRRANMFWDYAEVGFINAWDTDRERLRVANL